MCCIESRVWKFAPLSLFMVLCMFAGAIGASDELTWPIRPDLRSQDLDFGEGLVDLGDVSIWNTRNNLYIDIIPDAGLNLKLAKVSIHIVDDPADFAAILDKKKLPKIPSFDYSTDYLADQGILADSHREVIDLDSSEICWGLNPEQCPPNRYIIVHAELQQLVDGAWVDFPTDAYARNEGVFDRFLANQAVPIGDAKFWGYVTYPLAKPEPGHFVDANVHGLQYVTVTQSGTTGENGQFWYLPNERVEFFVGSLFLGNALGDRSVTPSDLFEGADMEDYRVLNVARLLQSLDADGVHDHGVINISEPVIACLDSALNGATPDPDDFFADDAAVGALINATIEACAGEVNLTAVDKAEALENFNAGMKAGNIVKRNISKTPGLKSDKAKIEIVPVYVPAQLPDGTPTSVVYYDADGIEIEDMARDVAKPLVVVYLDEIAGTGASDVWLAVSRDDGDTWMRRNLSRTAGKSSLLNYPGNSEKPMLQVKDNMIFVAWTDKYCRGGRPGYAITVCPADDPGCEICRDTAEGTTCSFDYPGDDAYWQDDLFGVAGPQRTVIYEDYPEKGEVPYSCVWTARAVVEPDGNIQWFKPERVTSGRRDAAQLFAGAGDDVAFAIVWQEDPKGLMAGEGDGPGDGWSGANTHSKTDIWYSYITESDFGQIDYDYPDDPAHGRYESDDIVDVDEELAGRVKALVPMSLPVRITDNEMCSRENIAAEGGSGDGDEVVEHEADPEGLGTHRYCGTLEGIGTDSLNPGSNPLCAYTVVKENPQGVEHNVCVTADGRLLDGNTGASRPNIFLQPYMNGSVKSAWAIIGYEESKGVGSPPEDEEGCGDEEVVSSEDDEDRYKPDMGKNVIYHSFDFANPEVVGGGGIINLPETNAAGNPVYLVDEFGALLLDWKGDPQLAYENARRVRFLTQSKSKAGASKTVLVALYRQGEEGSGKPADIFMRRVKASSTGNPYAYANFVKGAQNVSSVTPTVEWQADDDSPVKMLRWGWTSANLADSSAKNPYTDAKAHRGALNGDDLLIGYSWTPNWGRKANDKYDFYIRRSFNGGQSWTTDPNGVEIVHSVAFRVPLVDEITETVTWAEEVVTTTYAPGAAEPPRNVSNLRNNRTSVLEPRLVKTPGTILDLVDSRGVPIYPEDVQDTSVYQVAYGLEFNQNEMMEGSPQMPLDIYYSRSLDKGQRYEPVFVTPQGGSGMPGDGWNLLAKDKPEQGAAQLKQTPDGSRLYGIWLEEERDSRGNLTGSDIMFRRVDY